MGPANQSIFLAMEPVVKSIPLFRTYLPSAPPGHARHSSAGAGAATEEHNLGLLNALISCVCRTRSPRGGQATVRGPGFQPDGPRRSTHVGDACEQLLAGPMVSERMPEREVRRDLLGQRIVLTAQILDPRERGQV